MEKSIYDVAILGAGPAGLTAAIYASRAFLKTVVISGDPAGGQLMLTTDVENFPGFPGGILGPDLILNLRKQAEKFCSMFIEENVMKISGSSKQGFIVETYSGAKYKAKTLIVTTGASAKWLGLENEQRLRGKGVSACATCDGFFFKGKVVAVVGGGDAAMEESTFLTRFATKVYVLVRGSKENVRASKIMSHRAFSNPKIEFMFNTEVAEVLGQDRVQGLKIINNVAKKTSVLSDVEGLFISIGHQPNTEFLKGFLDLDEKGYVIKITNGTKTSKEGVFVAGDAADYKYRQAVTAAGMGCMAAIDAQKYLAGHA